MHIAASSTEEGVEIIVENNGPEIAASAQRGHGLGLSTTRARLMTAYGDRASLTLRPREGGGARVRIVLPSKVAPAPSESRQVAEV